MLFIKEKKYFLRDNILILDNLDIKDLIEIKGLEKIISLEHLSLRHNKISKIKGLDLTQKQIADAVGVTEVTLRSRFKELSTKLNIKI